MRKMRFRALLLAAIMTISCVAPTTAYAVEDTLGESSETSAVGTVPYRLRTELVDEYNTNVVRVWLELDPTRAESISAYQISLQLKDNEGSAVAGRGMTLEFDGALQKAQIKESIFDSETQIMNIYVAAAENLVQFAKDENGNVTNMLPIGILSVDQLKGELNMFKIDLSDNDGDLMTVDTGMNTVDVDEEYGADFVVPVDGAIYGEPVKFPLGIDVQGKGTVKAYVVKEDSTETPAADKIYESAKVRLSAIPAPGYRLTSLKLIDERNQENEIELGGNFTFEMNSVIGVKAKFEAFEETYTLTVGENAAIEGASDNNAQFKSRETATVSAKAPEGKVFSCWKNEKGDVVSYNEIYTFAVTSTVTLIPEFIDKQEEKQEIPSIALNDSGTVTRIGTKYRMSYSGVCSVPSNYKLVQRGIILTNKTITDENLKDFVMGGTVDGVKVATCAVTGTNAQFISNVNNVAAKQSRTARAFLTYEDESGNQVTIYSSNVVQLKTP